LKSSDPNAFNKFKAIKENIPPPKKVGKKTLTPVFFTVELSFSRRIKFGKKTLTPVFFTVELSFSRRIK